MKCFYSEDLEYELKSPAISTLESLIHANHIANSRLLPGSACAAIEVTQYEHVIVPANLLNIVGPSKQ